MTFEGVAAWVAEMASEGLSASRTRQAYHLFSSILDDAVKGSRLGRNPATGVELPRMIERPRRYLTHGQVADLADSAGESRTLILVLAYCGLRWGEVVALRVGRVDPLRGRLEVVEAVADVSGRLVLGSPKSHQHRSVPVPGFLRDELTAAMAGKNVDDLVFTSPEGAMLRGPNFRRHTFDDACRAAGLDGLTPHELRHTAASLAIAAGASVKVVQRMLGHASATLTLDRYGHLFGDELDTVAERLDVHRADSLRTRRGLGSVSGIGGEAEKAV
ncbi:MAG: tyrosine-type recombinase/integrase [Aeromicrobium sp.]